mmetsp:Transcript_506/g.600  ORF Transcript_506/g.600 Transcript_506/m.600 type:complete len:701 (-) Transcript_506:35-2137(-)
MSPSTILFVGICLVLAVQSRSYSVGDTRVLFTDDSYKLSFDNGMTWSFSYPTRHTMKLRYQNFDPLAEEAPKAPEHLDFSNAKKLGSTINTHLIQFETIALAAYKEELTEKYGMQFHYPMPDQGYIVSVKAGTDLGDIEQLPYVRWVGEYAPQYKLQLDIINDALDEKFSSRVRRYNIMTVTKEIQVELIAKIERLGATVFYSTLKGFRIEASLSKSDLMTVAHLHEVLSIDNWSKPEDDMDIARMISGADYVERAPGVPVGYTGQGVSGEVLDSGLRSTHQDFRYLNDNLKVRTNSGSTSHGTSVFGIIFGNGQGNAKAKGLLPSAATAIFGAYGSLGDRYTYTEALVDPSGEFRAVFQTNSWGAAQTTEYTSISAEMDDIIFKTDLLIFQSQSNTGNTRSRPQAWAKNIVSVGGVKHKDTLTRTDDEWTRGGSTGPASDGRIKPDLWHFYDYIFTTSSSSDTSYTPSFGGTSGATPITAGYSGLVFEMWADGVFDGAPGKRRNVFDSRPHSSTAKALMINTAFQYEFSGLAADYGRFKQGWGMVDLQTMFDVAIDHDWKLPVLCDECNPIGQSQTHTYTTAVPQVTNPSYFQATLVYRDPAGSPSASKQLINNINLRVTSPSGVQYWGNNGLDVATESVSGGNADLVNNVENVIIAKADYGVWTVDVIGTEINQDTRPDTDIADVGYSLVVTFGASPK